MAEVLNVKEISKDFADKLKKIKLDLDVEKIIGDFETKINKLNKDLDDLQVRRLNLVSDVEGLDARKKEFQAKVDDLSKFLAEKVADATDTAIKRVNQLESELKSEKERVIEERNKLGGARAVYEEKSADCDRLRQKLENAMKDEQVKVKEAQAIKDRLETVLKTIKDIL